MDSKRRGIKLRRAALRVLNPSLTRTVLHVVGNEGRLDVDRYITHVLPATDAGRRRASGSDRTIFRAEALHTVEFAREPPQKRRRIASTEEEPTPAVVELPFVTDRLRLCRMPPFRASPRTRRSATLRTIGTGRAFAAIVPVEAVP
jgi:hypothetical protein